MNRFQRIALVASMAAFMTGAGLAQNLVVNGGFEQFTGNGNCCPYCGSVVTVPGWTNSNIDHFPSPLATEGLRAVDINQCSPGWISQAVPTSSGTTYTLKFSLGAGGPGCFAGNRQVRLTCGCTACIS